MNQVKVGLAAFLAIGIASAVLTVPAFAAPLGAPTQLSPATSLLPNQTEDVLLDTKKLEFGVDYTITCSINNIVQTNSTDTVYAYFRGDAFQSGESLTLNEVGNNDPVDVTAGKAVELTAGSEYILTGISVVKDLDPAHVIRIADIDGQGTFDVSACVATPIISH